MLVVGSMVSCFSTDRLLDLCKPASSPVFLLTCLLLDIITDAYLVAIPIFMFWGANMPALKKIGLVSLFSGTVVVIIFAIVRYVTIQGVSRN